MAVQPSYANLVLVHRSTHYTAIPLTSIEEFVCKTRYIQQSSFEIISFLYLIVNAFDAKLNFLWVYHNGIQ